MRCLNTTNLKCIRQDFWCDGDVDCEDWSDENNCTQTGKKLNCMLSLIFHYQLNKLVVNDDSN